jgi:uncharacterized OB-fold protein
VPEPRPIHPGLFTTGAADPRLLAARCEACVRLHFPATDACPYCGGDRCTVVEVGPGATLFLFTTIARRPPGYRGPLPYGFGVVELPEGLRIVTRLSGIDERRLAPGLRMRLVIEPIHTDDDGAHVHSYAFTPDDA